MTELSDSARNRVPEVLAPSTFEDWLKFGYDQGWCGPPLEEWRPVAGHPHYQASDQGSVRSIDRTITHRDGRTYNYPSRVLRPGRRGKYLTVNLGQGINKRVHVLVAEAFIGPRPEGMNILHSDDNPENNKAENIRYGTQSENLKDSVRNGTHPWSTATHCRNGHDWTVPENVGVKRSRSGEMTARRCLVCHRESTRKRRTRNRGV